MKLKKMIEKYETSLSIIKINTMFFIAVGIPMFILHQNPITSLLNLFFLTIIFISCKNIYILNKKFKPYRKILKLHLIEKIKTLYKFYNLNTETLIFLNLRLEEDKSSENKYKKELIDFCEEAISKAICDFPNLKKELTSQKTDLTDCLTINKYSFDSFSRRLLLIMEDIDRVLINPKNIFLISIIDNYYDELKYMNNENKMRGYNLQFLDKYPEWKKKLLKKA